MTSDDSDSAERRREWLELRQRARAARAGGGSAVLDLLNEAGRPSGANPQSAEAGPAPAADATPAKPAAVPDVAPPTPAERLTEPKTAEQGEIQPGERRARQRRGEVFPAPIPGARQQGQRRRAAANAVTELPTLERPAAPYIPPIPVRSPARSYGTLISFVLCVVLPVLLAAIYYTRIASPQYVAEFRFAVKDTSSTASSTPGTMATLLGGMASSNTSDNYLVTDYLSSRGAVGELQSRINVKSLYSRPNIDWWSRFDATKPMEKFVTYWQNHISASYDQVTGLAVAEVRAFSPEDAYLIASTLVKLSEELINRIATRSQNDAVKFAEANVKKAEDRMKAIRAKITEFRNRVGVIDPASSVVASNSNLAQTLRAGLAQLETSLSSLRQRRLSPTAPAVISLQSQINATRQQLADLEANVGKEGSLSTVVGQYEQLELERQFAQTMLTTSVQALEQARANAASQHLYVTPYVRPSMPESSTYPNKVRAILFVAMIVFMIWAIGLLIVRSIREHFI